MPQLVHPFHAYPGEQSRAMSLLEFNNSFIELDSQFLQANEENARVQARKNSLDLGLTGFNAQINTRVVIEPLRNRLRRPYELNISRDYDSLISFTDELPVSCDLYIYRIFHSTMTLRTSLHVKVHMRTRAEQACFRIEEPSYALTDHASLSYSLRSLCIPTKSQTSALHK